MSRCLAVLLFFQVLLGYAAAEPVVSSEFGFFAIFPSSVEKVAIQNSLGPLVDYGSIDEKNIIIHKVQAHKILQYKRLQDTSTEAYKDYTKTNFDGCCKAFGAKNVKFKWTTLGQWPVIEYSYEVEGVLAEGVKSYMCGYHFLAGDTFFRITCHGIENTKKLKDAVDQLYASFGLIDAETLKRAQERGVPLEKLLEGFPPANSR